VYLWWWLHVTSSDSYRLSKNIQFRKYFISYDVHLISRISNQNHDARTWSHKLSKGDAHDMGGFRDDLRCSPRVRGMVDIDQMKGYSSRWIGGRETRF
jgi:hypothetical protein